MDQPITAERMNAHSQALNNLDALLQALAKATSNVAFIQNDATRVCYSNQGTWPNLIYSLVDEPLRIAENDLPNKGFLAITKQDEALPQDFVAVAQWQILSAENASFPAPNWSSDVEVIRVSDETVFKKWQALSEKGFGKLSDEVALRLLQLDGSDLFIAEVLGKPAGSIMTYAAGESTGIYFLYVDPDFRKFGCGRALLFHAMNEASSNGTKKIVGHVTNEGWPLALLLNPEEAGTVNVYFKKA